MFDLWCPSNNYDIPKQLGLTMFHSVGYKVGFVKLYQEVKYPRDVTQFFILI